MYRHTRTHMHTTAAYAALGVLIVCHAGTAGAAAAQKNTTGLPTCPHDANGKMDAVARALPNGQQCTHYSSSSTDALQTIIDWYKKAPPGARVEDVNKDSLYGNYFKLEGVKLLVGNDIVNVYRLPHDMNLPYMKKDGPPKTTIELFKCRDAAAVK